MPGYEAPVNLVYSQRNRSASIRIPMYSDVAEGEARRVRCPDPTANPYLAFAAMLMAGLDGIERGLDPGEPGGLRPLRGNRGVTQVPGSLEALGRARGRPRVPARGGVSREDSSTRGSTKREQECDVVRLRPHPAEFALYFDA